MSVSPDGRWLAVATPPANRNEAFGTRAIPVSGGRSIPLCHTYCGVVWDNAGKTVYISAEAPSYVLPLVRDTGLPKLPDEGFETTDDFIKAKPLGQTSVAVLAAQDPGTYAFVRHNTRRNLYRIPLP